MGNLISLAQTAPARAPVCGPLEPYVMRARWMGRAMAPRLLVRVSNFLCDRNRAGRVMTSVQPQQRSLGSRARDPESLDHDIGDEFSSTSTAGIGLVKEESRAM